MSREGKKISGRAPFKIIVPLSDWVQQLFFLKKDTILKMVDLRAKALGAIHFLSSKKAKVGRFAQLTPRALPSKISKSM